MIIATSDENHSDGQHFAKDIETNSVSEDGSSCTGRVLLFIRNDENCCLFLDSTSSSMTLPSSSKAHLRLSNIDEDYVDEFDNDEEDDWKPKKKRQRTAAKKNKINKKKNLVVVVSPSATEVEFPNCIIPLNKLR